MYKKVLIMSMLFLSSLNFCFGANIQCWEEYRTPWDSQVTSNYESKSNNFSASDSKLYNTLKDKATVFFVGVVGGDIKDGGMRYGTFINAMSYSPSSTYDEYIALKFCAVFNDSGSSTSSTSTSISSTAAVNYIIKAK